MAHIQGIKGKGRTAKPVSKPVTSTLQVKTGGAGSMKGGHSGQSSGATVKAPGC